MNFNILKEESPRKKMLTKNLNLKGKGLELGPMAFPILKKRDSKVYYVDYTDTETLKEKNKDNSHVDINKIVNIDFVWEPAKKLIDCVPENLKFEYVLAVHVIEHVPNAIEWLNQISEVLSDNGVISLAIPDKRYTFDAYRNNTSCAELIECYIRNEKIPTPRQIYDNLSNAFDNWYNHVSNKSNEFIDTSIPINDRVRLYSDAEALNFATFAQVHNQYIDVHCTVWTPESLSKNFKTLNDLNLLNCEILEISENSDLGEFIVQLKKRPTTLV